MVDPIGCSRCSPPMVAADDPRHRALAMRLAKYLAHAGVASRRAAEALIARRARERGGGDRHRPGPGRRRGQRAWRSTARLLDGPEPRVALRRQQARRRASRRARDTHGRPTVVELVPARGLRLYPVGRLDADSSGLILLTNDGELANRLTHPSFQVAKTYRARARRRAGRRGGAAARCAAGSSSTTAPPRPRACAACAANLIELTIREGRNRQVRRMCAAVGHPVLELRRDRLRPAAPRTA